MLTTKNAILNFQGKKISDKTCWPKDVAQW